MKYFNLVLDSISEHIKLLSNHLHDQNSLNAYASGKTLRSY